MNYLDNTKGNSSFKALSIMGEYVDGVDLMNGNSQGRNIVTVFGGARASEDSAEYKDAQAFGKRLAENKYSVLTGGGPGIMEATNKGHYEFTKYKTFTGVSPVSIGIGIQLPFETANNKYLNIGCSAELKYFFIRKTLLIDYSCMFVLFKGGFGTLDELFEILTLMQTGKIKRRPIYLVDGEFWNPMKNFIHNTLLANNTINEADLDLITVVPNASIIPLHNSTSNQLTIWKDF